jgi:hypothetical protein
VPLLQSKVRFADHPSGKRNLTPTLGWMSAMACGC